MYLSRMMCVSDIEYLQTNHHIALDPGKEYNCMILKLSLIHI